MAALPPVTVPAAKVGYLMPWGLGAARLVVAAQAAGLRVRFADEGFTVAGRAYPTGTAIIRSAENPADTAATLSRLVTEHRAEVVPIDSAFTEAASRSGSNEVVALKAPRVLLAWDRRRRRRAPAGRGTSSSVGSGSA